MSEHVDEAESELRELVAERVAAVAARDAGALAARQHSDIVEYDVLPPLRSRGSAAVGTKTENWFAGYREGPGYDVSEVEAHASGDVGFVNFLYHVSGTLNSGHEVSMWVRATLGCRKIDGRWLIVHDHESIPWDPETGQGLAELAPE